MASSRPCTFRLGSISKSPVLILLTALVLLNGCTRAPLKDKSQALRPAHRPYVSDDLGAQDFLVALDSHIATLEKVKIGDTWTFGDRTIPIRPYVEKLRELSAWAKTQTDNPESLWDKVAAEFEFLEVYGTKSWGRVMLTSYFEPEIRGSLVPTPEFSQPFYSPPSDIIDVAIGSFDERFNDIGVMRGRMARDEKLGRNRLFPYYTRAQIDGPEAVLKGKHLELCWANPVDAFFMQVQGSGTVVMENGTRLRLGYADQNGHKYHSIGKFLTDIIPLEKMTLFRLESYLSSVSPQTAREVLFKNPSYVFFRKLDTAAITSLGGPVSPGRTIATDGRYFPKGALAFLQFKRPVFAAEVGDEVRDWQEVSRFVFDQDSGGAIRGGGRADLFWGTGAEAKRFAGVIKDDNARLYYLVPKGM